MGKQKMTDDIQSSLNIFNAVSCGIIAARIFWWRLGYRVHNIMQGIIIYLFIISYADVTFRSLMGAGYFTAWSELVINLLLCMLCMLWKKNIFQTIYEKR
jgi:Putative 3TM holin, Phage_holin_3